MKSEIKQRIEQIKAGQVPDGYKRTRAGIMPYDWCCDREYRAKDIFKSITNKKHNGEFDVLSATQDKGVIPREQVDINIKYNKDSVAGYKKVDKGDFVISLRSFQGGIEYSEYEGLVSPAYTVLKPIIPICDEYYKYYFKTSDYINRLNIGTYGIRDGKQIGYEDFGDMVIHYPPLAEQEKIVKILSVQDGIIELYQRKIEELQKIKKIYLSKMFPKKGENAPEWRFSQFNDSWEQRKLSEIYDSIGNAFVGTATPYYVEQGHFYLESNNIKDGQINHNSEVFINDEFYERQKNKWLHAGDMVMVQSGHVGHAAVIPEELDNSAAHALIMFRNPKVKIEPFFLNYQYQTRKAKKKIEGITTGNTIKHILASNMQEFVVDLPDYDEQKQIGSYFRNLDNLIALHQRKLEEMKKYKKALMQLLLTGIVRV